MYKKQRHHYLVTYLVHFEDVEGKLHTTQRQGQLHYVSNKRVSTVSDYNEIKSVLFNYFDPKNKPSFSITSIREV